MEEIVTQCLVAKTHFAFLFIDKTGSKKLPSASFLALFKIVITTNHRFSNEWRNGSFEEELKRKDQVAASDDDDSGLGSGSFLTKQGHEACPLLKVIWLRMIVDEGHSMGRGMDNCSISFASWIHAERRWAMTGTPTRQTITQSGLSNVLNLMQYLNHDFFSRCHGGDVVWKQLIVRGWNRGHMSSFYSVLSLFSLLMIRHTKSDLEEVPPPIYSVNVLPMSREEVSTYNTLVCAVQSNLLITSMIGKTSGKQDSLLHKSQIRHAREAISNLRLVCVGGTKVHPTLTEKNWSEFLTIFDGQNDDKEKRQTVRNFLARATAGFLSPCDCCQMMLSSLLVFPCGHLVCTECVENTATSCVLCNKIFDVDEFQKLQPGFEFQWGLPNIEDEQWKPAGLNDSQGEGDVGPNAGIPFLHLVLHQPHVRARTHNLGDGHTCEYSQDNPNGECRLCFRQHEDCYLVEEEHQCKVCHRRWEECPERETKAHYVVNKLLKLYKEQQEAQKSVQLKVLTEFRVDNRRPLKVIIFSQFRKTLNQTGDRLLRRFSNGCVAEYWGIYRKKELRKFIHDTKCFCMLLGKDGSEGLDLSFVTHIIFLEQVWDKSLESQVVSRAWRMGAKGSVNVETLIAQDSIEETMAILERGLGYDDDDANLDVAQEMRSVSDGSNISEYQRAKLHYLLRHLKLISNSSTLAFGSGKKRSAVELYEAVGATEVSELAPKKARPEGLRVRFQEQQMIFDNDVN
jgi:SNF2 family DNA or RNA helicase